MTNARRTSLALRELELSWRAWARRTALMATSLWLMDAFRIADVPVPVFLVFALAACGSVALYQVFAAVCDARSDAMWREAAAWRRRIDERAAWYGERHGDDLRREMRKLFIRHERFSRLDWRGFLGRR